MKKRILVLSDSHGYSLQSLLMKAESMGPIDAVFHLGDGFPDLERYAGQLPEWYFVQGNCDWQAAERERVVSLFGKSFLLAHGHHYSVKSTMTLYEDRARELGVYAALFGHTHIPYNEYRNGILFLNPGAAIDRHFALLDVLDGGELYARMY